MVKRFVFAVVCLALLTLAGCELTGNLIDIPLTDDERLLLAHWKHVQGSGNVWNREFIELDRSAHYFSTNMILGSSDVYYHWTASSSEIAIYERDFLFAREHHRYEYRFITDDVLLIGTEEYDRQ